MINVFSCNPGLASKAVLCFSIWREPAHLKDKKIATFKENIKEVKTATINLFASELKGQEVTYSSKARTGH